MKRLVKRISIVLAFLCLTASSYATVLNVYDDQEITSGTYESIYTWNNANLIFNGGTIQDYLWLNDNSTVSLNGGNAQDFLDIILFDATILNISHFQPDSISYVRIGASTTSTINFYVLNYSLENGILSGYWSDGTYFTDFHIRDTITESQLVFHIVPEPTTIMILGFGYFLIKRRS